MGQAKRLKAASKKVLELLKHNQDLMRKSNPHGTISVSSTPLAIRGGLPFSQSSPSIPPNVQSAPSEQILTLKMEHQKQQEALEKRVADLSAKLLRQAASLKAVQHSVESGK